MSKIVSARAEVLDPLYVELRDHYRNGRTPDYLESKRGDVKQRKLDVRYRQTTAALIGKVIDLMPVASGYGFELDDVGKTKLIEATAVSIYGSGRPCFVIGKRGGQPPKYHPKRQVTDVLLHAAAVTSGSTPKEGKLKVVSVLTDDIDRWTNEGQETLADEEYTQAQIDASFDAESSSLRVVPRSIYSYESVDEDVITIHSLISYERKPRDRQIRGAKYNLNERPLDDEGITPLDLRTFKVVEHLVDLASMFGVSSSAQPYIGAILNSSEVEPED